MTTGAGSKNQFVFVVCGGKEHIETLHYALRALQQHTRNDILVLTDTTRNEIAVEWHNLIDVRTPEHFSHHQASIYLKTGVYQFVPSGPCYCYLDTDVVAVSPEVDAIFAHKSGVVTFAADQHRVHQFSRFAVKCPCEEQKARDSAELNALKQAIYDTAPDVMPAQRAITECLDFQRRRANLPYVLGVFLRFLSTPSSPSNRYVPWRERWRRYWFESQDTKYFFEPDKLIQEVHNRSKWRYDGVRKSWVSPAGNDIYNTYCNHLVEEIERTFRIRVADPYWQHWNGGVFLFDAASHAFLEAWHNKTLQIFEDPAWRIRDQGTLIATAWEFGLQSAPVLPRKFNLIVDFYDRLLMVDSAKAFITLDAFLTREDPVFVHVFYRFGDTNWDIWNWVNARVEQHQSS